jgi:hypothetical protein
MKDNVLLTCVSVNRIMTLPSNGPIDGTFKNFWRAADNPINNPGLILRSFGGSLFDLDDLWRDET